MRIIRILQGLCGVILIASGVLVAVGLFTPTSGCVATITICFGIATIMDALTT